MSRLYQIAIDSNLVELADSLPAHINHDIATAYSLARDIFTISDNMYVFSKFMKELMDRNSVAPCEYNANILRLIPHDLTELQTLSLVYMMFAEMNMHGENVELINYINKIVPGVI